MKVLGLSIVLAFAVGGPVALLDQSFAAGKTVQTKSVNSLSAAQRTAIGRSLNALASQKRPSGPVKDGEEELNLLCGIDEWIIMYDEDGNGNPVTGTCVIKCGKTDIQFC